MRFPRRTMDPTARREFERTALPHLDGMYGMALRLTRNQAEAEDLVQEAMVRAYRFWHTFKPGTSARSWLFSIVRNTFINRYHQGRRRREVYDRIQRQVRATGEDVATPAPVPTPEAATGRRMTREHIEAALASIPEDYRTAVSLADLEGFSYKEIAEVMQCPIGTVMSRIYRGRRLLHGLLSDHARELGLLPPARPSTQDDPPADTAPVSLNDYRRRGNA